MKKLLTTITLLVFSYTITFAQETEKITPRKLSFSPYVGMNITDMRGGLAFKDELGSGNPKSSSISTVAFGIDVTYKFSKYFGINLGLFTNIYSSKQRANVPGMKLWRDYIYRFDDQDGRKNYVFVNLPIQGVLTLPFSEKIGVKIMGGGYVGYFVYANYTDIEGSWGYVKEDIHSSLAQKYDNINFGLLGDVRLYHQISKRCDIWAGVRYTHSLNEIKNTAKFSEFADTQRYQYDFTKYPDIVIGNDFNFTPSALGFLFGITIK